MILFGSLVGWLGVGLPILLLLAVLLGPHNWRISRARRAFRRLPDDAKKQVLDAIRGAALSGQSLTFLRLSERAVPSERDLAIESHVGGLPYVYGCDAHPEHCRAYLDSH
ncbi:MAG: hypothetical protein HY000_33315 [Planctomycetes bacterium]|nr:hypothetical protein [Planctomycetota bacterium]